MGASGSKQSGSGHRHSSSFNCFGGGSRKKYTSQPQSQPQKQKHSWFSSKHQTPNWTKPMSEDYKHRRSTTPTSTRGSRGSSGGHSWWPSDESYRSHYGGMDARVAAIRAHQRQRDYMSSSGSSWGHCQSSEYWGGWPSGPGHDPYRNGEKIPGHRRWKK
jgi:hypothetical protein